ncbi:MAG TPA: cell surface protein SprA [Chitinophagaceae bacterium]|nr:cell surface protein SprA [Chitinophagaceae bacterium]
MNRKTTHIFRALVATLILFAIWLQANAGFYPDPTPRKIFFDFLNADTTRYPIYDRYGDPYTYPNRNPFALKDTSFIKKNIVYDPVTKQYYIEEKVGSQYYRTPVSFTMKEFLEMQGKLDEQEYFRKRANLLSTMNRRSYKPKFQFFNNWVNRITGNGKIDIRPNGYVDIMAGYQGQNSKNPTLPERARKNGGFDFNMNSQLQVDANIGDKLKLPINYNTLANFDYENQLKLDYHGQDDEILKLFQAGNVNFNSKGTLIPGAQSLFGIKTELQFGKLFITTVLANQRSTRQSLGLQGGAATQKFSIKADEYEENRHFLLAQYFRSHFNEAMKKLPIVSSAVQIQRIEVWVTNRTGATTDTRDIVALADLGEGGGNTLPDNAANSLYSNIRATNNRSSTEITSILTGMGLQPVQDFEKTFARKLLPTEYYFNPQIGFISLNQQLQPDEVLAVAFQYTYNGKVRQVGEFSQDIPPDSTGNSQKVLFLKLLKATSQRPALPIWDLMMKNVYSVGYGQLDRKDFQLDLLYEEPSLGQKRYLPADSVLQQYKGQPILSLVNLDRLNDQNDPQPNGFFDYIEGFTVISSQSRIIFPVLEPFGHDLDYIFSNQAARDKYLYYPLYDTIKAIAQTYANLNRFKIEGRSTSGVNSDYQLGYNIPKGSVTVTAGGQILRENIDYEINYDLGTLKIINPSIISTGLPVQVQYENNATFGLQQKNYIGVRLDYLVNRHLTLGATMVRLGERPFFTKTSYGEDPIKNTMIGADFDYRNNIPRLSKWLDKLPFYSTKAMSSINAYGEFAALIPGHPKQIGKGRNGQSYIDDFEGTRSSIDLRFPLINWTLASVPQGNGLFPESALNNDLASGFNRAKIAWYNIEPVLQERNNPNNPLRNNLTELSKPESRLVLQQEIFPEKTTNLGQGVLTTFDIAYYPREKGPYNFRTDLNPANGQLLNPKKAFGGIMRNIDQTDFETSNIEYLEFWLQNPFINRPGSSGGQLYFNLGNISEDILKDGKRQYENGLPTPHNQPRLDQNTVWGQVPSNPLQVTNAFSNEPEDRPYQDVGYDGLIDTAEQRKFADYLNTISSTYGNGAIYQKALNDPSNDNFKNYRDESYSSNDGILARYKDFNNPQGNSPVADNNSQFTSAFTLYPDQEDLNRDNTMNEAEEYFQYRVDLMPGMNTSNNPFITDVRETDVHLPNGSTRREQWYLFRIPIHSYQDKIGNIPDFKSIRFIRMFLTNFDDTVVCRFAKLELVRNQWRKFNFNLDTTGLYTTLPTNDPVATNILAVNLEENDSREPIPYRVPPGVDRQQELSNNNVQLLLNEQSLSFKACGLSKDVLNNKVRGVFKTMNLDLRQYGRMSMFIHLEDVYSPGSNFNDGDVNAVIRIGNDFAGNYYEVKIPLKVTRWGATDSLEIWPAENNLDFDLQDLVKLKKNRDKNSVLPTHYYSETLPNGRVYGILGSPNLGEVRGILMGLENVGQETVCAEAWFNELRLSRLDEKGGYAAIGRVDINLADLGNLSLAGSIKSTGFGTLEQRVNERSRQDDYQFDVATNLDLGKLLPKRAAIQIPIYAGINRTSSTPEYDPYDQDIKLKDKLKEASSKFDRDSIRNNAEDITTTKTVTLTNVKKNRTGTGKPMFWDISNFDFNYSYISIDHHNPLIENEEVRRTRGAVGYTYSPRVRPVEPFKRLFKSKSPWLGLVRDFNFNYTPSLISVKADVFRQFGAIRPRNVGGGPYKIPETYNKYFLFDRYYVVNWDITKSIRLDYTAVNHARVDEPEGRIDTKEKKDSVRKNFFDGGRTTHFGQDITVSYVLPMQKLPLLAWTTIRTTYTASYDWNAASLLPEARLQGNTLINGQTRNINGEFNFDQLYNKSKFLRLINNDGPIQKSTEPKRLQVKVKPNDTASKKMKWIRNPKWQPAPGKATRFFGRMLLSLKRIGVDINEDMGTTLPGYLDSTQFFGRNFRSNQPGWGFIFGRQPDTSEINKFGDKGLLTRDSLFNTLIQQRFNQKIRVTAQLSPIRDLNIDVNLEKTFDKQYSELYKDTSAFDNVGFTRLNPYALGSFNITYISYQTLFKKFDPNTVSETFKQFEANRTILSQRLNNKNPYSPGGAYPNDPNYYLGYGRYAQDVVIPAFLAAYTDKDPLTIPLIKNSNAKLRSNPFSNLLPRPNWNITYSGLSKIKAFEKIFTNFTIRHGYQSNLSMNSFNTALRFTDPFHYGYPEFIDTSNGINNFVPYFLVPNVTISERFNPLIGFDISFVNQLSANFEYGKSRTLSLSLIDYQLAETRSTEVTVGINWRKRGVPILKNSFRFGKKEIKLDNDVTFKFDFSLRDDATANSKLDQNTAFGTRGQKVINISPSIDYVVNSRVNVKLFFEQNRVIPKIATTAPVTNTRGGVQIRISLAQ